MRESSIPLSACLGRPLPTSTRAQGCPGPCLGAFDAGSDANRAGQDDRGSLGWTDPCWRRTHATQMSPHPQTSVGGTGKSRTLTEASETSEYFLKSLGISSAHLPPPRLLGIRSFYSRTKSRLLSTESCCSQSNLPL